NGYQWTMYQANPLSPSLSNGFKSLQCPVVTTSSTTRSIGSTKPKTGRCPLGQSLVKICKPDLNVRLPMCC
ncbi:hypothetical protein BGZ95_000116, partial [Linnemannia exigua]